MIVYLANPYGFSKQQKVRLLPQLVKKIESLGHEVWEPFARNNQNIDFTDPDWPYYVGQKIAGKNSFLLLLMKLNFKR